MQQITRRQHITARRQSGLTRWQYLRSLKEPRDYKPKDRSSLVFRLKEVVEGNETPFCYVRYGDREFFSINGRSRRLGNDRHHTMPSVLGPLLKRALLEMSNYSQKELLLGACLRFWPQAVAIGTQPTFPDALPDRILDETHDLLLAVRDYSGRKILVASQRNARIASGLKAEHLVIPQRDVGEKHEEIKQELDAMIRTGTMLLFACGPIKHLVFESWKKTQGIAIDCGHIFDPMLGKRTRQGYRRNRTLSVKIRRKYAWIRR